MHFKMYLTVQLFKFTAAARLPSAFDKQLTELIGRWKRTKQRSGACSAAAFYMGRLMHLQLFYVSSGGGCWIRDGLDIFLSSASALPLSLTFHMWSNLMRGPWWKKADQNYLSKGCIQHVVIQVCIPLGWGDLQCIYESYGYTITTSSSLLSHTLPLCFAGWGRGGVCCTVNPSHSDPGPACPCIGPLGFSLLQWCYTLHLLGNLYSSMWGGTFSWANSLLCIQYLTHVVCWHLQTFENI